jgi:predicted nucleic acid-binding protein
MILGHPFVVGELACGTLENRKQILSFLSQLPPARAASDEEVLSLIESRRLMGTGLGWIDAHLAASALLSKTSLWTMDRALRRVADRLGIFYG